MPEQTSTSDLDELIIPALAKIAGLLYIADKACNGISMIIDNITDLNQAFITGIMSEMLENNLKEESKKSLDALTEEFYQMYGQQNPSFINKIQVIYNSEISKLQKNFLMHQEKFNSFSTTPLTDKILYNPNLLLKPQLKNQITDIFEKLAPSLEMTPSQDQNNNGTTLLSKSINNTNALLATAMGYTQVNMYKLGRVIAQNIDPKQEIDNVREYLNILGFVLTENDTTLLANYAQSLALPAYSAYQTLYKTCKKINKLPNELTSIATASLFALTSGVTTALLEEKQNNHQLDEITESSYMDYLKMPGNAIISTYRNWKKAYNFQYNKISKLDRNLNTKEIEVILNDKPWKDTQDLLMRKSVINIPKKDTILPVIDKFQALTTATKATIFSTAYTTGHLLGKSWSHYRSFSQTKFASAKSNSDIPQHTPPTKSRGYSK